MMPRTIFLARLLGLFFLLTGIAMLIRRDTMVATVMALLRDEPLLFALGMSALAVGLAMVLMHNVWSGGVLPVVVTLLGWTFVIRSWGDMLPASTPDKPDTRTPMPRPGCGVGDSPAISRGGAAGRRTAL